MTATEAAPTRATVRWPPGMPRSLDYPEVTVGSMLRAAVRRWGRRTAFLHHDVPLSFDELGRRAHAVAAGLAARGIGRGDVVAVHLPNCRQYPAVYYGVLLAGATFRPARRGGRRAARRLGRPPGRRRGCGADRARHGVLVAVGCLVPAAALRTDPATDATVTAPSDSAP